MSTEIEIAKTILALVGTTHDHEAEKIDAVASRLLRFRDAGIQAERDRIVTHIYRHMNSCNLTCEAQGCLEEIESAVKSGAPVPTNA